MYDEVYSLCAKIIGDTTQFQESLKKAQDSLKGFDSKTSSATDTVKKGTSKWSSSIKDFANKGQGYFSKFGGTLSSFASKFGSKGKIIAGILACAGALHKLGKAMDDATSEIVKGTGAIGSELDRLENSMQMALIDGVGVSAKEAGTMIADLNTRFDVTGKQLTNLVTKFDDFSRVTGVGTKESINNVANVIYKWNLEVEDTDELLDKLVVASQKSGISVGTLTSQLTSSQAIFSQFDMSVEDSIALLSTMAKNGINTENAITGMRTALAKFASEGKDPAEEFKKLSEQIKNAETETEALKLSVSAFGTRSGAELVKVFRNTKTSVEEMTDALQKSRGQLDKTAEASRTVKDAVNDFKSVFKGAFGQLGQAISGAVKDIIDIVSNLFRGFARNFNAVFGVIRTIITGITGIISSVVKTITEFVRKVDEEFGLLTPILNGIKKVFQVVFTAIKWSLIIPIKLMIVAIDGLKIAFLELYKHISKLMKPMGESIAKGFNFTIGIINKAIDRLNEAIDFLHLPKTWKMQNLNTITTDDLFADPDDVDKKIKELKDDIKKQLGIINEDEKEASEKSKATIEETVEDVSKILSSWNDKLLQQRIDTLKNQMNYELDSVEESENAEEEKYEIKKKYLTQILELELEQLEKEKQASLEGVKDTTLRGKIELYYLNELKNKQEEYENALKKTNKEVKKDVTLTSSLTDAWKDFIDNFNYFDEIKNLAKDSLENISESFGEVFSKIGESIAGSESDFLDYLDVIKDVVAEAVKELAKIELMKTIKEFATGNWVSGIIHGLTAIGSFIAGGIFGADLKDEVKELTESIQEFIDETKDLLKSSGFSQTIGEYIDDMNSLQDTMNETKKKISSLEETIVSADWIKWYDILTFGISAGVKASKLAKQYDELNDTLAKLQKQYDNLANETAKNLNKSIEETVNNIDYMRLILNYTSEGFENLSVAFQKTKIVDEFKSLIESIATTGVEIGSSLVSSIVDGATKTDFLRDMKKYISENLIKLAVYTEEFQNKLAEIGAKLSKALIGGDSLVDLRIELEALYDDASNNALKASQIISEAFGDISDSVTEAESAMESFYDSIQDLSGDIASELINGLEQGLEQGDFLSSMQEYIRKMLIQTVVYTESMKSEIEAIGKAISKGLTEGFSDESLHEIRRDLSYLFEQANSAVSNIDSVLSNVFTGYATGTQNATSGIHLVGEQGPELVRFRGGEQVYNASDTRGILSGSNMSNNFNVTFNNVQDTTAYAMMKQLKSYNREMAINGII